MGVRERLLADYDHEVASTRRVLGCLTDVNLTWRPHERARTLGELATHLAHLIDWAAPILAESAFDLERPTDGPAILPSRHAILAAFDAAAARARRGLDRSDAEFKAPWSLTRDGAQVFTMPREAAFRAFVLHHLIHHRGQLTVYLRLLGLEVPPIYGPTADAHA